MPSARNVYDDAAVLAGILAADARGDENEMTFLLSLFEERPVELLEAHEKVCDEALLLLSEMRSGERVVHVVADVDDFMVAAADANVSSGRPPDVWHDARVVLRASAARLSGDGALAERLSVGGPFRRVIAHDALLRALVHGVASTAGCGHEAAAQKVAMRLSARSAEGG